MTTTLFDLTYQVAREITTVREGTASGGSSTTIVDAVRTEPNDYWNSGVAWIVYVPAAAAPEGQFSIINDFDQTSYTITLNTTLTGNVINLSRYAISNRMFPLDILRQCVNRALFDLGKVPTTDITTVDTATNQTEYDLPIGANLDLREVWLEMNVDDDDDYRWRKQYNWYVQRTAIGTADKLVLPYQWPSDREVKLVYVAPHDEMNLYSDKLSESIPPERIVYRAAYHALRWYWKRNPRETAAEDDMNRYENIAIKYEIDSPIKIPQRTGKIVMYGGHDDYTFTPGKVRL